MKPVPNLARYKRLSAARQETLFKWLSGDPAKKILPLSYAAAAARMKKEWFNGKRTFSVGDLCHFYQWYPTQKGLLDAKGFREKVGEFLAQNPNIDLESDRVLKAGQIVFEQEAIVRRDKNLYISLRRLRQKDLDQAMDRDQFEVDSIERFLKWRAIERLNQLADSDIPHGDKVAAMRKVAFRDIDALQKSGKIKLPE